MFWQILLFELRYQLRRPLLWLMVFFFGLMTFGAITSDSVQIGGAIGNVHRNAPFVIVQMMGFMGFIGIFLTTMFVAGAILRDFDNNTHELFFSRPVKKRDYLLGRFTGACLVAFTAFLGTPLGIFIGSKMPWLEAERLGPFTLSPYLFGLAVIGFPTLFFSACVFFSLASLSRSMLFTYLGVVAFIALYSLSGVMLADLDNQYLAALADPFGIGALQEATKYWTIVERNSVLPPLGGVLLHNRLLWTAIGLVVLMLSLSRFRTTAARRGGKRRLWFGRKQQERASATTSTEAPSGLPVVTRDFDLATAFKQFFYQTRVEVMGVLKGVPFLVILAFGTLNLVASSGFLDQMFGTPVWPVTHLMLRSDPGHLRLTYEASTIVSNLDPNLTFRKLLEERHLDPEFSQQIKRYKFRGSSGKVNLALDRVPEFTCRPGIGPHLMGDIAIAPSFDYLEKAYDQAKYGEWSQRPYLNVVIPSLVDPSVAPPGKHVMSIFVQYAPYKLKSGPSSWPQHREAFGDTVIDTLAEYCPGLKESIIGRQVLTPWDLEQEFGLTEGNIFQGELSMEQLLFMRPTAGWARYKTPIRGLWMCGSATHPGGGIMGAPGELAAKTLLASGEL